MKNQTTAAVAAAIRAAADRGDMTAVVSIATSAVESGTPLREITAELDRQDAAARRNS